MSSHKPIILSDVTVSFLNKICFEDFSAAIYYGDHIALIGDNGSGKSTLLSLLAGGNMPYGGAIVISPDIAIGYLPQDIQLDQNNDSPKFPDKAYAEFMVNIKTSYFKYCW